MDKSEYIIEQYKSGKPLRELERELCMGRRTIKKILKSNNLEIICNRKTEILEDKILELYNLGWEGKKIADELKISPPTMYDKFRRMGLSLKDRSQPPKQKQPKVVPNIEYFDTVKDLYENDCNVKEISELIGLNKWSIYKILHTLNIVKPKEQRDREQSYRMATYNIDENFFEIIDTEEKAYFLGLLYADGCCYKNTVILGLTDRELVESFKNTLNYNGVIEIYKKDENCKPLYKVRIRRKKLFEDLLAKGCVPHKSLILEFPNEQILPKHLINHFVRGWFDGDGCIHYTARQNRIDNDAWMIALVGTKEMLEGVINNYGIYASKYQKNEDKNTWRYLIQRQSHMRIFLENIYKDATIKLDRKYNKALQCLQEIM